MASRNSLRPLAALAMVLALGACGSRDRSGEARRGGTAVVAINVEPQSPNPLVTVDRWSGEINRFLLYLPLVQYGPKLDYQPRLASSWEMLGDTGVVFHLRRDVRWTDGRPTTSADVVFTYQRASDTATAFPNREYFTYFTGVDAPDPYTVRFHFKPHTDPLAGLPFLPILPRHLLEAVAPRDLDKADFNVHPVGNGPFVFVEHRANDRWVFRANPDFPRALGGRPLLDRLVLRVVPEPTAQLTALVTGEADVTTAAGAKAFKDMAGRADVQRIVRPQRQVAVIIWNGLRPALRDPRVRLALALALDRRTMLDALRGGFGALAVGPLLPGHWAYAADLQPLPYAPDSARKLLAAAGYADRNGDGVLEDRRGRPLEVSFKVPASSSMNRNLAEMVQAQLGRVGVRVRVESEDALVWRQDIESPERRFDAVPLGFDADFRPMFRDQFHSASLGRPFQWASYANPAVDSIIDRAPTTADQRQAAAMWHRFQEILRQDQPWTFLWYPPELVLARSELHGVDMDVRGALVNASAWWRAPAAAKD